jgi:hypothetical protein
MNAALEGLADTQRREIKDAERAAFLEWVEPLGCTTVNPRVLHKMHDAGLSWRDAEDLLRDRGD